MYLTPISIRNYNICLLCEISNKGFSFCEPIRQSNGDNKLLVCKFYVPIGVPDYEIITLNKLYECVSDVPVICEDDESDIECEDPQCEACKQMRGEE